MVNSADPDQLASSDVHCLLKVGMSFSAREGLIAPGLKQVNIILLLLFFFFFHMIFMKLPLKFRFLNFGYLSIWKLMFHSFACWVILHSFLSTVDFFFYWFFFFKKIFQEYHQSVKQFGSRSGLTFCRAWSGSKLFAKVISSRCH